MNLRNELYIFFRNSAEQHLKQPLWLQAIHAFCAIFISIAFCVPLLMSKYSHVWIQTQPIPNTQDINGYSTLLLLALFWSLVLHHVSKTRYHTSNKFIRYVHKTLSIAIICIISINVIQITVWWVSWQ